MIHTNKATHFSNFAAGGLGSQPDLSRIHPPIKQHHLDRNISKPLQSLIVETLDRQLHRVVVQLEIVPSQIPQLPVDLKNVPMRAVEDGYRKAAHETGDDVGFDAQMTEPLHQESF